MVGFNDVEIPRLLVRTSIEKLLKIVSSNTVIRWNPAFTRQRFDDSVQLNGFTPPVSLNHGLDCGQGQPLPWERLYAKPTFGLPPITTPKPHPLWELEFF